MREGVFPKVYVEAVLRQLGDHAIGSGELVAPGEGTRVSVRLPAWLESEDITGDAASAQISGYRENFILIRSAIGAIPEAKTPARRKRASTRKQVVSLNNGTHLRPSDQVDIHSGSFRYFNQNRARFVDVEASVRGW